MSPWSEAQVLAAAPDDASVSAARKLAQPGSWSETGNDESLLWGKCQGSGKTPYQVSVDLDKPAYRCSCPSRKFPCKHCLALLLMWARGGGNIAEGGAVAEFAAEAAAKATLAAQRAQTRAQTRAAKPVDPEARAKRLAKRLETMDTGIEDFAIWVTDLVRTGLAAAKGQPTSWWEVTARRLVDAQLPGLADSVREMSSVVNRPGDWVRRLLDEAGLWQLCIEAWRQRGELDPDTLADLRVRLGWPMSSDEVRESSAPVSDQWQVIGVHRSETGRLREQRTWLVGQQRGELVLALDFGVGRSGLPVAKAVGSSFTDPIHRYPGHAPARVLLPESVTPTGPVDRLPKGGTLTDARREWSDQLSANPWAARQPVVIEEARFTSTSITDPDGVSVSLTSGSGVDLALACTGGHPVRCFGEMEGGRFRPLTIEVADSLVVL